jgi:hypothetical protein
MSGTNRHPGGKCESGACTGMYLCRGRLQGWRRMAVSGKAVAQKDEIKGFTGVAGGYGWGRNDGVRAALSGLCLCRNGELLVP